MADAPALAAFGSKTFFDTFGHLYPESDANIYKEQRFNYERTCADIDELGRYFQLAYLDDILVGFIDCGALALPIQHADPNGVELYRLYVMDAVKGTGLAHELMHKALLWAHNRAATHIYLGVYHDNARAQTFYRKFGFEIIGAYKFRVGHTLDDEHIMSLKLN